MGSLFERAKLVKESHPLSVASYSYGWLGSGAKAGAMIWKLCRREDTNTTVEVILQQVLQLNTGCAVHYSRVAERVADASFRVSGR